MSPIGELILVVSFLLCLVLSAALGVSLYFNWKLARIVFRMEDGIEEALDRIDAAYRRVGKVLENPVGSDDPYVVEVVDAVRYARSAVLDTANQLMGATGEKEKNDGR